MAKAEEIEEVKTELAGLKNKLKVYEQQFESKVQEHPIASMGIAFGTGVLVGALVSSIISRRH